MTDQDSQSASAAEAPAGGFFNRLRARLQPDPGSSDPMKLGKWFGVLVALYLVLTTIVGIYWSSTPDHFDVRDNAARYAAATDQPVVVPVTTG